MPLISRVSFNFLDKCNMNCPFCYCPFEGVKTTFIYWQKLIDRLFEIGIESITFGGGDPFMYKDFVNLLGYTYGKFDNQIFIQIDTNGLALKENYYSSIKNVGALLGLPIESTSPEINFLVRKNSKYFENVKSICKQSSERNIPVKINTVVNKYNIDHLSDIGHIINSLNVKIWSLYQFWPLGDFGFPNQTSYLVEEETYNERVTILKKLFPNLNLEIGSIANRKGCYFFLSHTGKVYTINPDNSSSYLFLGDIFDDAVILKWNEIYSTAMNRERFVQRFS